MHRAVTPLVCALLVTGCADVEPTAPHHHPASAASSGSLQRMTTALGDAVAQMGRYIRTELGQQPTVTPMLRIEAPTATGRLAAGKPVTIRVRYRDFDFRPDLRTPNAGATLGSAPQVVVDGVVQGHIHGYLQRIPEDGALPAPDAVSFCVLERTVSKAGYAGIAEGECPGVEPGEYRLSAEFQTNSHTAILKTGPRATITGDVVTVRVR